MEEGFCDEVAPGEAAQAVHLHCKESEYSIKHESGNMRASQEMLIPVEGDYSDVSPKVLALDHQCASPRDVDDAGIMVEELTVRNYDGENLAVVGTSNHREKLQTRQTQWQHFYQLASGSRSGSPCVERNNDQAMSGVWEDVVYASFPEFLAQNRSSDGHTGAIEELTSAQNNGASGNTSSHVRTKILSRSGFSEFFVKTTLKGKGIVYKGPAHDRGVESREQTTERVACAPMVASNASPLSGENTDIASSCGISGSGCGGSGCDGVSLREWLRTGRFKVNKVECLHIFRQLVDLVDYSHNQGVALLDLRPSSFKMLQTGEVKYVGSTVQRERVENVANQDASLSENSPIRRRQHDVSPVGVCAKKLKVNDFMNLTRNWPMFSPRSGIKIGTPIDCTGNPSNASSDHHLSTTYRSRNPQVSNTAQQQLTSTSNQLEEKWYASPEELNEGVCTASSNVYSLGVFLFELLGNFDSGREHAAAMSELRHRILPPDFLSENPKEAGFCLWLLHPQPSSRPTTREIRQSEVIKGLQEVCAEELSPLIEQDDTESELLLHFLISLKEQKQKQASKLVEDIRCLETDIEEVDRRHYPKEPSVVSCLPNDPLSAGESNSLRRESSSIKAIARLSPNSNSNEMGLMRNINQLETAYFSMRSKIQVPETDTVTRPDKDLLRNRENCFMEAKDEGKQNPTDRIGAFFEGLCKYARYNKFEVRGMLRSGDFNNSANVICSLSFDRDKDYFAAAGVSKKIKIFECDALFNNSVDIHYPVIEMTNRSKLSCISWNNYIKNYLVSTDYDGIVKLWDASTGQAVFHYIEHEKRAWSVDFSRVYPTKLASGSDDCCVKLWSINENNSLATIRNIANVCCVQFSAHSTYLLAFGSADYRTYCYDLRNTRSPWCVLAGHEKAVSHVKFLDSETLVTASTDNTLKLWDLKKTSHSCVSTHACSSTLTGHTNEKNFVGLSVADDYIACGSETNEVYAYHRSLPMPITAHKFGSIDPITGKETEDDNGHFVSSVCWRGKSDMLVAANSSGCIKILQMV